MHRLFLDANILFSAAYRAGAGLTRLWQVEGIELITSDYAAQEARVNLSEEDQHWRLTHLLKSVRLVTEIAPLPPGIKLPAKDQPILQAAIQAHATHLLTGDKDHFGALFGRRPGGVLVLPPAEYFARLRRGRGTRR